MHKLNSAFLLCLVIVFGFVQPKDDEAAGQRKLQELFEKRNSDPIIRIEGNDFEKYLTKGPRPYHAFTVLTATKSGNCSPCEAINGDIAALADLLRKKFPASDDYNGDDDKKPVFVMEVDYLDNKLTFQSLGLNTAPMVVMVPPTKTKKEMSVSRFLQSLGAKYTFAMTSGRDLNAFIEFITKTTGMEMKMKDTVDYQLLTYIVGGLVGFLSFVILLPEKFDMFRRSMLIYGFVSLVVLGFVLGGGMFNFIRDTPWANVDKGKVVYISHMSRYQFQAEGYLMGAANLLAGVGAWIYINAQRSGYEKDARGKRIARPWASWIPIALPFASIIAGWFFIVYVYNYKNSHYQFGHVGMKGG